MPKSKRALLRQRVIAVAVASCYLANSGTAQANPSGGTVTAGGVTFTVNGNTLTVTNTPGAIINWQQFSIQRDEITRFIQQNAASSVLNRVIGQDPSVILGQLLSNGRVFLINPSGIAFGQGAVINVAGLAASTLNISDADFLSGRMRFVGTGGEGKLTNAGTIRTPEGGHVYLVAPQVENQASGVITSPQGEVVIAAGKTVELVSARTPDIRVEFTAPANEAVNAGQIVAASGRIGVYGTLIRNSGLVSASRAEIGEGGKIVFKAVQDVTLDATSRVEASGAKGGEIKLQAETGTLLAQGAIEAKGEEQRGGSIQLLGDRVGLVGTAGVDASGQAGGGTVLVGGDSRGANPDVQNASALYIGADTSIRADATGSGDGGSVVLYSSEATRAYGAISARGSASGSGGSVETSGRYLEVAQGPDVTGGAGGGSWLIDPYNIQIVAGTGTFNNTGTPDFTPNGDDSQIGASLISNRLNAGISVTVDTGGFGSPGTQPGNLTVSSAISKTTANSSSLGLLANNDLTVDAGILMVNGNLLTFSGRDTTVNSAVSAGTMSVTAGRNLSIVGSGGLAAGLTAQSGQSVSASGSIELRSQGGSVNISNFSGDQSVSAGTAGLSLQTLSPVGTAQIFNGATGTQGVFAGDLNINAGFGNAVIQSNGTQTVVVNGGSPSVGHIRLANSTTGFANSFAGILAPNQNISASGDVTLTAGFAPGTSQGVRIGGLSGTPGSATNLSLNAGRDVILTGGSGAVNGAALGTSATVSQTNTINVAAGGNFIMNSGPDGGTRVGSGAGALAGGDISITAGNSIQMNGTALPTAIRTLGSVTLRAENPGGTISQASNGSVRAGSLTTRSNSTTTLSGPNQVAAFNGFSQSSGVTLINTGALNVAGLSASGDTALTNAGAVTITGAVNPGIGALNITTIGSGSDLSIANNVSSGGAMNLNVAGGMSVNASGTQSASVATGVNQTINAQSLSVTAQNAQTASVSTSGGAQNINIAGGSVDVQALTAGRAQIATFGPGVNQNITVGNGDHINVIGTSGDALLSANAGVQTITIAGSGANAINVGSAGATGTSQFVGQTQSVIAGLAGQSGSISIVGPSANGRNATIATAVGPGLDTQFISTSGTLSVTGGTAASGLSSGVFHNRQGQQTINAANIALRGGASGLNNAAFITSNSGSQAITTGSLSLQGGSGTANNGAFVTTNAGDQVITVAGGAIGIVGGTVGSGNRAGISTGNANQTITGNPAITLTGGASGGAANNGNNAFIMAGGSTKLQKIDAGSINVAAGAGGIDNSATITGVTQVVTAAGNVVINGGNSTGNLNGSRIGGLAGASPSATDLTLTAAGDVVLTGGSQSGAGASLGSTNVTAPLANKLAISAGGNIVLNGGSAAGARIGSAAGNVAGGDISINANGIQLNGTTQGAAIRTTGNVTLNAGSTISENATGSILANGLTTTSNGSTSLTGPNQVASFNGTARGGDLTFNNGGALNVTGISTIGNTALTNSGTVTVSGPVNGTGTLAVTTTGPGSNIAVASHVSSGGAMNLNAAGGISVTGSGTQDAIVSANGGQSISAQSLNITAQGGGSARLLNDGTGSQTIAITGGNIDVVALAGGGSAQISNLAPGGNQSIAVTNGDRINVNGTGGSANLNASTGQQTISISGSGANAITVGSTGALGTSGVNAGSQSITAGLAGQAGSISVIGADANNQSAFISTAAGPASTQTISTSGAISVVGGRAPLQSTARQSGIFNTGTALQTISATDISVTGGASGSNNGAFISGNNTAGGDQIINATGSITLTGGTIGNNNRVAMSTANGNQTINGNPGITVTGGANGSANSATISGTGIGKLQTINAGSITINAGAGGTDSSATITGNKQTITAIGNVTINGGGSGGTLNGARIGGVGGTIPGATDLTLGALDVILAAGTQTGAGAGLGSSNAVTPAPDSKVTVNARNVILNSGTAAGARIGGANGNVSGGDISVTATNSIQLNGTGQSAAIRTTGNVTLHADGPGGTISAGPNGFVLANGLTATSNGSTSLTGPNQVASFNGTTSGGDLTFNNTGALSVTGISTIGNTALTNLGTVTLSGPANSTGTLAITTTGAGSSLTVANNVSSGGAMNLNAAAALTVAASGTQNANVSSVGGQTVGAQSLNVSAQNGSTASLVNNGSGNQTVTIAGGGSSAGIDVQTVGTGGTAQIINNALGGSQTISVTNAGHINVNGAAGGSASMTSAGGQSVSITGIGANALNVGSVGALGSSTVSARNQTVTAGLSGEAGSISVVGADTNGLSSTIFTAAVPDSAQSISTSGTISVTGGRASLQAANRQSGIFNTGAAQQTVTGANIVLQGGPSGTNNGAFLSSSGSDQIINVNGGAISVTGGALGSNNRGVITSSGNQTINGNPSIVVTGGAGGSGNSATISATGVGRLQTINAGSININAGAGGVDNSATITGTRQVITTTGNVTLNGGGSTGTSNGSRIGGLGGASPSATDLTLSAGGDVVLTAGSQASAGAALGSTNNTATPLDNKVSVNASGSVILNSGTGAGARIGSTSDSVGGGDLSVSAGSSIQLNGTAQGAGIRTQGNVTLNAGSTISAGPKGSVLANALTTTSNGSTSLTGPNQVASFNGTTRGGDLTFNNSGALNVTGISAIGNTALTNGGAVTVSGLANTTGALALTTTGPGSTLTIVNNVFSGGAMNVNVAGGLNVVASGTQDASLTANGGQTISAQSLAISAQDGRNASLVNNVSGDQTITIAGGGASTGVDVQTLGSGGFTRISNDAAGGNQTISVTNADHFNLNGSGGGVASITAINGVQTISISGSGTNAITVGGAGALGASQMLARSQSVTAGLGGQSGSISIVGAAAAPLPAVNGFVTIGGSGTQTFNTSGTLSVTGGTAAPGVGSGLFHNGSGQQTINAASISVQGGLAGSGNGAFITANNGGDQVINASGNITVAGGAVGNNNRAAIAATNANQTISGGANIAITGGASGGAVGQTNLANIGVSGAGKLQTISAGTINLSSGAGGVDNSASMTGPTQVITATGDVVLTGGASTGTLSGTRIGGVGGAGAGATNLTLNVGRDLLITGGAVENNGAGLGATVSTTPLANTITVTAGGNVILNEGAGAGARIGYSSLSVPAGGDIAVTAGGSIQLNGVTHQAAIRTQGNVTLNAASIISAGSNGFVLANGLTTNSMDGTRLTGANQVATFNGSSFMAGIALNNSGALNVTGISTRGDTSLSNAGSVTVSGLVNSGGAMNLNVAGGLNVVASGTQDASLTANAGQTISAQSLAVSAQDGRNASLVNNVSGNQTITIAGGGAGTGVDVQTFGSGGFIRIANDAAGGNQTISVTNADRLNVNGSGGGFASITALNGTQTISITGGGANAVTVGSAGSLGAAQFLARSQSVTAGLGGQSGSIVIAGAATLPSTTGFITLGGSGTQTFNTSGTLSVTGSTTASGFGSGVIQSGSGQQSISAAQIVLQGGSAGSGNGAFISSNGSNQDINVTGGIRVTGGAGGPNNIGAIFNNGSGQQTINAASISVQGGAGGSNNGAFINSNAGGDQLLNVTGGGISIVGGTVGNGNRAGVSSTGNQTISGNPNITITGGASGGVVNNANNAFISSSAAGKVQAISAGSISVISGAGGTDNSASITGATQLINATGNVSVSGGGGTGTSVGGRIGGVGGATPGATNLTLTAGGDVILTGGSALNSGGGLGGSGGATAAATNTIRVTAGGNVVLNGGTGAAGRIGYSSLSEAAGGDISVTAGGSIQLNGTAQGAAVIRTLGNVALHADNAGGTISEGPNGFILANGLTTASNGSTSLTGPNRVSAFSGSSASGSVTLNNIGALAVNGVVAAGNAVFKNAGVMSINGPISTVGALSVAADAVNGAGNIATGGGFSLDVSGDSLLGGVISGAGGLTKQGAGSLTLANANTYSGTSTVNGGTLVLASGTGSLATASSLLVDGGTFDAGGNTQALAGVQLASGTIQNGTLVSASNYDVRSGTIGANLAGSAGLDKTTGAIVIVSGSNSYSGDTNVLAGTLAIGGSDRANTGVVNIAAGATYRGSAGSFTNSGVIAGSGTLDVSSTSFTNSGTLRPGGTGAIGTLTVSGNAILSPTSLLDVEAQGAGNHDVVAITGAASLNGALGVTPINGYAPVNGDGLAPLTYASRTGTVYVATDRWLPSYNPASLSLVFDSTLNRWVGTSGNWNVAANWSRGHVPVLSETVLIDVPGAQLVTVSDGARFAGKLSAFEDFLVSGGSLNLGGPSFFNAALTMTGGVLQGSGAITANSAFNWSGGTLAGTGLFVSSPTAVVTLAPFTEHLRLDRNWLNQGSVTLDAAERASIKGDGAFQNDGTLNKIGLGKAEIKTGFSNSAGGTLNVDSGVLKLEHSRPNAGSISIAEGATLKLDGDFTNNGRISGSGAIEADRLFNRGVMAPGANGGLGIGTFMVLGDFYQGSTGVLEMGLGGTASGQFDVLAVSGKAHLDGTLLGIAVNGYTPQPGQAFKLITYESRTGAFSSVVGPAGFDLAPTYRPRFGLFTVD